ncbi:MAG: serine/threonine protein kinase, partial [Myxococcales bacterium]|nr:serine/threonine protein kinase [Myxococcales bacterium]
MEPEARFCWQCGEPREGAAPDADGKPVADPLIGRVVENRYRIVSLIARGGMGVVYKVEHVHIGKVMAMKLLHGELSGKRDVIQRFRREAEAASHLSHPNTVQIFDFGSDGGLMYLVMEYLDGDDLGVIVRRDGTVPFTRLARIGVQLAGSVGEAHAKGIVHRDLKPE